MNETFMEPITDADKIPKQRWKLVRLFSVRSLRPIDVFPDRSAQCATYGKAHVFSVASLPAFSRSTRHVLARRSSLCR